jgi:uncharacterized membrane protein YjfL (UPF0719 family)
MNSLLVLVGLSKLFFGMVVAVVGLLVASKVLGMALRIGNVNQALREGNLAVGTLEGASIVALALVCQPAVEATFTAMDFLYRGDIPDLGMLGHFLWFAVGHVGIALAVGVVCIASGALVYDRLTSDIDELSEVARGNVAPALAMGALMISVAILARPGLQTTLDGLIPMPAYVDTQHQ